MMTKLVVQTSAAPLPIGPYSQAIGVGNLIFTSGQIPLDPQTGFICQGGISEQTRLVLEHLQAVLTAAGSSLDRVIKTTVFLKDMSDFAAMNEIYGTFFQGQQPPARTTIEVARLPKDALVEIEAIAIV